jgi:hypothetical protein
LTINVPTYRFRPQWRRRLALLSLLLLVGCAAAPAAQRPAVAPSVAASIATATSAPASAVPPTALPTATATALPTATPSPTPEPTPEPTATPQPLGPGGLPYPLKPETLQFGVAAHLFYINRNLPLRRANEAGFGWIRQQVHWKDQEGPAGRYVWGELDSVIAAVHAANLKLLLSVVRAPSFYTANGGNGMPKDPRRLGNFVAALTKRYQGKVQAIEIWNEQNLAHENGGRVAVSDAGHYVELLKEAYTRIKAVDPSVYVIAGAPSSTGITRASVAIDDVTYYKAMYGYQNGAIRDYFDAQAVHPGGAANPPDTMWPDNPSTAKGWTDHPTFYFRHVEDVRALMEEYGLDDHPIWITEFGWATPNGSRGFEYGNQTSLEEQADYIVGAMRRTKEQYPWVGAMFLWNLNYATIRGGGHEQASFGILTAGGSPRPAFLAIQQYLAELRGGILQRGSR